MAIAFATYAFDCLAMSTRLPRCNAAIPCTARRTAPAQLGMLQDHAGHARLLSSQLRACSFLLTCVRRCPAGFNASQFIDSPSKVLTAIATAAYPQRRLHLFAFSSQPSSRLAASRAVCLGTLLSAGRKIMRFETQSRGARMLCLFFCRFRCESKCQGLLPRRRLRCSWRRIISYNSIFTTRACSPARRGYSLTARLRFARG